MKTNIPDHVIPTELSSDNRITTTYTTNTLIPRLGPLTVTRYLRAITLILRDYQVAAAGLKRANDYHQKYAKWVRLASDSPVWSQDAPRYGAPITGNNTRPYQFVDRLSAYNNPKLDAEVASLISSMTTSPAPRNVDLARRTSGARRSAAFNNNRFSLSEFNIVNNPGLAATIRENLASRPESGGVDAIHLENIHLENNGLENDAAHLAEEAWDLGNTLHLFAGDNRVVSDLVKTGHLRTEGDILSDELKTIAAKPEMQLAELMSKRVSVPQGVSTEHVEKLVTLAVERFPSQEGGEFVTLYQKKPKLRAALANYIWDYFKDVDILGGRVISVPTPDDTEIVNSREWAFQRTERLDMKLSKPEFRGPVSADSVAPNSVLTTREVRSVTQFAGQATHAGQSSRRTESHTQSYSKRFQVQLDNMTEEGIQNESEFTQNSTLFSTLRDQRRASIDQVISQISSENEVSHFAEQGTSSQASREYITKGVDPDQAVTELSFQVVSPVRVEVSVQDVSLAWCPRVISPFMNLHRLINDHTEQARREYLDQNTIIDPVRPVEVYEKASFKREKHARGRHATQSYDFSYEMPAEYSGWTLDRPACVVGFRNGTGDDYNWDEAWNWDDLENWNTYFQTLSFDDTTISGRAVLTTTDPEYFNRGFLKFNFGLKKLSEESRVALENYARERQEAEAQRLAVVARANQYARLRRDELIASYDNSIDLLEEAYRGLIKQIFDGSNPQHHSYYAEVIRSCIDWDKVGIHFESGDTNTLPYPHLLPSHYLNTPAIRLTLPIYKSAEQTFFDAIEQGAGTYHNSSANAVNDYVTHYRNHIETLRTQDPSQLLLDSYDSEMILGRHLEAVLSRTLFDE